MSKEKTFLVIHTKHIGNNEVDLVHVHIKANDYDQVYKNRKKVILKYIFDSCDQSDINEDDITVSEVELIGAL